MQVVVVPLELVVTASEILSLLLFVTYRMTAPLFGVPLDV